MNLIESLRKPDPLYGVFCAYLSLIDILDVRGYDVFRDSKESGDIRIKKKVINVNRRKEAWEILSRVIKKPSHFNATFDRKKEYPKLPSPLQIIFVKSDEVNSDLGQRIRELSTTSKKKTPVKAEPFHILYIAEKPVTLMYRSPNGTAEFLCYQQLLINPLKHWSSPLSIKKLSEAEEKELFSNEATKGMTLPVFSAKDPTLLYIDLKSGDAVRVFDVDNFVGTNSESINYRRAPGKASNVLLILTNSQDPNIISLGNQGFFLKIYQESKTKSFQAHIIDVQELEEETTPFILKFDSNYPSFLLMDEETFLSIKESTEGDALNLYEGGKIIFYNRTKTKNFDANLRKETERLKREILEKKERKRKRREESKKSTKSGKSKKRETSSLKRGKEEQSSEESSEEKSFKEESSEEKSSKEEFSEEERPKKKLPEESFEPEGLRNINLLKITDSSLEPGKFGITANTIVSWCEQNKNSF